MVNQRVTGVTHRSCILEAAPLEAVPPEVAPWKLHPWKLHPYKLCPLTDVTTVVPVCMTAEGVLRAFQV